MALLPEIVNLVQLCSYNLKSNLLKFPSLNIFCFFLESVCVLQHCFSINAAIFTHRAP